jgi:hypothetical protein
VLRGSTKEELLGPLLHLTCNLLGSGDEGTVGFEESKGRSGGRGVALWWVV